MNICNNAKGRPRIRYIGHQNRVHIWSFILQATDPKGGHYFQRTEHSPCCEITYLLALVLMCSNPGITASEQLRPHHKMVLDALVMDEESVAFADRNLMDEKFDVSGRKNDPYLLSGTKISRMKNLSPLKTQIWSMKNLWPPWRFMLASTLSEIFEKD